MEKIPSWSTDQFSASQEIPRIFFYTRKFITAFTRAHDLSLSWVRSMQSIPTHTISWRSILILSSLLSLAFQVVFNRSESLVNTSRNIFTYVFLTNVLNALLNTSVTWSSKEIRLYQRKKLLTANPTRTGLESKSEMRTEKPGLNRRAIDRAITAQKNRNFHGKLFNYNLSKE